MSEDENATTSGGHKQQQQQQQQQQYQSNTDQDSNNSIIGKMRSRVSNILPQTLSKWFSPVSGDEGNRNGSLRRRRDEMQQNENTRNRANNDEDDEDDDGTTDDGGGDGGGGGGGGSGGDTDNDDDDEPGILMPPTKRSKLNITEDYSITNPYMASSSSTIRNRDFHLSTSTPTTPSNRRRHLNLMKKVRDPPYIFSNANTTNNSIESTSSHHQRISSNIVDEPRYMDDDMPDTDVLEVIPEHDEPIWDSNRTITSRRSLNIPSSSSLRRPTLLNVRSTEQHNVNDQNDEELDEEEEEEEEVELRGETRGDDENSDDDEVGHGGGGGGVESDSRKRNNKGQLVLTNGKVSRNVIQGGDTGSESGDSQYSSNLLQRQHQQKLLSSSSSRLFGIGSGGGSKSSLNRTTATSNIGLNFYTHLEGKKSLFSDKTINMKNALNSSTTSLTSLNRRQSFNASLYGSTSALSDSRLLNISSPFYKGRTTYGGASAYSKYSQQQQQLLATSMIHISRTPTSIRPSSSLSSLSSNNSLAAQGITAGGSGGGGGGGNGMTTTTPPISSTAKRILELMNQFTTPLTNAKKMANTMKVPSLIDHKRRFNDDDVRQSRAIRMNAPKTPYSRPQPQPKLITPPTMPPINELHVPSMANLLQMKKLQNNIEKVREIANASRSNLNTKEEYKLPSNVTQNLDSNSVSPVAGVCGGNSSNIAGSSSNKHISKIRNKTTSIRNSTRNIIKDDETSPSVNLPEIPLPLMKSVPKIDITIPTSSLSSQKQQQKQQPRQQQQSASVSGFNFSTKAATVTASQNQKFSMTSKQRNENSPSCSTTNQSIFPSSNTPVIIQQTEFKFSMPLEVTNSVQKQQINIESVDKFNFSKPIPLDVTTVSPTAATVNKSQSMVFQNFKFQPPKSTTPTTSKAANESRKIDGKSQLSGAAMPQLKTGSVLDALKKQESTTATSIGEKSGGNKESKGFGDQFKMPESKWECSVCMIRNDSNLNKCEACQTPRKGSSGTTAAPVGTLISSTADKLTTPVATVTVKNSFGDMFKPKADSWECPDCMITNKNEAKECVACKASKPGDKVSSSSVPKMTTTTTQDDGFKNLVAQQSSKWECPACLTRNEQTRSKCVCCEQEKPGTKSPSTNIQRPNLFGATAAAAAAAASAVTSSKFTFGFTAAQKEEELKKSNEKPAVTSSSNEKEKSGVVEVNKSNKGFSFGSSSSSGMVSSSTFNTTQGASSQPPLMFGFKSSSSSSSAAATGTAAAPIAGKDVPDVSTSNFKFGTVASTQSPKQQTQNNTTTATTSTSGSLKTFTFGINKPIVFDAKTNTTTTTTTTTGMTTFKFGSSPASTSISTNEKQQGQNKTEVSKSSGTSSGIVSAVSGTKAIFGSPASLTNAEKSELKTTTITTTMTPSLSSSSNTFGSSSFVTQKPDSTADSSKNLFTFGGSSVNKSSTENDSNKKLNFSFGSSNNNNESSPAKKPTPTPTPTFSAFSPSNVQKSSDNSTAVVAASNKPLFGVSTSTLTSSTATTFSFAKPSTSSPFAIANSGGNGSITSTNTTTNIPSFGSSAATTTSTGSIFGGISSTNTTQSNIIFGSGSQQQAASSSSNSIFGSSFSSASNNNTSLQSSSNQPSNLFSFGSTAATVAKTENSGPVFGSVSSTTTTANKPFAFGGLSNQPTTTASSSSSPFAFGAAAAAVVSTQKPSEGTSLFGSAVGNTGSSGFSVPTATVNSSQQQAETKSAFGQPLNPFGGSNVSSSSSNTPAFGTNPSGGNSIFGSAAPTFGSTGFGTNNTTFGATAAAAAAAATPSFGSSFGNSSSNEVKKPESAPAFNFGTVPQGTPSGVFTFGANNNNQQQQQQPFSFSANTAPSFNFSATQETTSNAPFQFSAAGAIINPANNIFAPTPGSSTTAAQQAARRKMRPRRTQPR